jgi:hypothetical protein
MAQQPSTMDGVRRTRWMVVRNCYDDQTEILTEERGWVLFRDLDKDDRVATLQNGTDLVFEKPSYHYAAPYKGEMLGIQHQGIDLLVTPDHKLWTSRQSTDTKIWHPYRHETISEIYGKQTRRFKRDALWRGKRPEFSLDFYEFLGFWFAEGYAGVQSTRLDYTRDLLNRAGLQFSEIESKSGHIASSSVNFVIRITPDIKPLVEELTELGKSHEKHIPQWIKDSSWEAIREFLIGYVEGDGQVYKDINTVIATTVSKRLADDIQELALRAGMVVTVGRQKMSSHWSNREFIYTMTFVTSRRREPSTKQGWYRHDYDGMVYCVTVSSHVVYVRRNGKAVWCGQTYGELRDTTIKTFHQWFPPRLFGEWIDYKHEYNINAFENTEIEILFRALDRPDHMSKLLSLELTGAWVNEAREVPWPVIEAIQGRVGQFPPKREGGPTWSGLILDTNPPDTDSDWYRFFEEEDHPIEFRNIFRQPSGLAENAENVTNLPNGREYYERLSIGKSQTWTNVYIHGKYDFVTDGRPVYDEYNDDIHCKECQSIEGYPIFIGLDFGLTPAATYTQVVPGGQCLVLDELSATGMGIERFTDELILHNNLHFRDREFIYIGDPAGSQRVQTDEKTCYEIMAARGIPVEPGMITLKMRLECVRKPLRTLMSGKPQFVLHPRCRILRRGFIGGYQFRRINIGGGGNRYTEIPDKNRYSHLHDALQYSFTRIFGTGLLGFEDDYDDDFEDNNYNYTRNKVTGY